MRSKPAQWRIQVAAVLAAMTAANSASAVYLDESRDVSLRARIYTQAAIRLQDSRMDTVPSVQAGQLVQHRNFFNPELDAKLTKYTEWMRGSGLGFFKPDEFSFRIAGWAFYDGIYDYGTSQFGEHLSAVNPHYPEPKQQGAFFLEGDQFNCPVRSGGTEKGFPGICLASRMPATPIKELRGLYPGHDLIDARDLYAHQERVNELYLSYTKGPFFLRFGRQAISWGEADTIALLDQNNPFDITRGPPGAFQDLDEARIPLWTIRSTLNLYDDIGPFQSGFLEAYWVPGFIDTNTGDFPVLTASPYSPRGIDPQSIVSSIGGGLQFVLFNRVPNKRIENSRYGARFQTIIGRNHTLSVWFYTHFPNAPVPRSLGISRINYMDSTTGMESRAQIYTIETVHELSNVYGIADTFYFEPLDVIFRGEVEYFQDEPSFIPERNLGAQKRFLPDGTPNPDFNALKQLQYVGTVPEADYVRWEVGLDKNFFFRPLNPSNSFLLVAGIIGSWNTDETGQKDFRYQGQRKNGNLGTEVRDFVQLNPVEVFGQFRIATSYLHGRLDPSMVVIGNVRGTHALLPGVDIRINDSLLFGIKGVYIGGAYQQLGFYKDRDQIAFRMTYQLN